ncbi:MAG: ADOP family duplicated permease [Gemmatimonadales bacterium]
MQQPRWLRTFRFPWPTPRRDVDEELAFHFDERIAALIASGLTEGEATRQAEAEFGDRDSVRRTLLEINERAARRFRRSTWLEQFHQDTRLAFNRLRRTPIFSATAVLTLAVAIGATASVFGVVNAVLLKALPLRAPDRVLVIVQNNPGRHLLNFSMSPLDFMDYSAQSHSFAAFAGVRPATRTVTGGSAPERGAGSMVTPGFFAALGVTPVLGRPLAPDSLDAAEVVIGYGLWKRRYGGASTVLGQKVILDDKPYTIVGVMPAGLPGDSELWTRLIFEGEDQLHRDWHVLGVVGRLKDGVTREDAQRDLELIAGRLAHAYPQSDRDWSTATIPLLDEIVGPVKPSLQMLFLAAGCVLLIGMANMANLFLVRCLGRERELAVRTALGATRGRLVRELLAEATILGVVATTLGVGLAAAGIRLLRSLGPSSLPRLAEAEVDGHVLLFSALAAIVTVLIFGALPAWLSSRHDPADAMKEGGRGTSSRRHHRVQHTLVVLQVAVALVLLTGTGLLVKAFEQFRHSDLGFHPDGVLTASIALPEKKYSTPEREGAFVDAATERLASLPGVNGVAASSALPGTAGYHWAYMIVGDPASDYDHATIVRPVFVSSEYLRTMGIQLKSGRGILPTDNRGAVKVALIDERFARQIFAGRNPIGERLVPTNGPDVDTVEVVGVTASVKQGGLVPENVPWVYLPLAQSPIVGVVDDIVVHTVGDPTAQASAVRRVMASVDGSVPVYGIKSMDASVAQSVSLTRFSTFLASLFATVAIALGMIGIYSVLAYIAGQRKREVAIRIALGASRSIVVGDVIRHALVLTGLGVALGSAGAWWIARVFAGLFAGVSPHDPGVFAGAALLFVIVALIAAAVPAFRSANVNPVSALSST